MVSARSLVEIPLDGEQTGLVVVTSFVCYIAVIVCFFQIRAQYAAAPRWGWGGT